MRKGIILALTAIFTIIFNTDYSAAATKTDKDGHILVKKWEEYAKYEKADRPQKQEKILDEIIQEAVQKGLAWDFCDAADKYYSVVLRWDWKKSGTAAKKIAKFVNIFDNKTVTYLMSKKWYLNISAPSLSEIQGDKKLRTTETVQLYEQDYYLNRDLPEFLRESISCDYEYLLWSMLLSERNDKNKAELAAALQEFFDGQYPQAAYVEFYLIGQNSDSAGALAEFEQKYRGRAVALFARSRMLKDKFESLKKEKGTSDEFRSLRAECEKFESDRKAFKSDEGKLVADLNIIKNLVAEMDEPGMRAVSGDDRISVYLKNSDKVEVEVYASSSEASDNDSLVCKTSVVNEIKSYFIADTLTVNLPVLNDGVYLVKCKSGKMDMDFTMSRNTLSVAAVFSKDGMGIYVTEYQSGKPVEKADVSVTLKDKEVWSVKDLPLEGFTPLGPDFTAKVKSDSYYNLTCTYKDEDGTVHISRKLGFNPFRMIAGISDSPSERLSAWIYKDNAAFHPGDAVNFKAVVGKITSGKPSESDAEPQAGLRVKAELVDTEGNTVDELLLKTNEWGSVAGKFILPSDKRNGNFQIRISHAGEVLAGTSVLVDSFKLPDFDIKFAENSEIYLPGDSVTVRGVINSYSSRPLSSVKVTYTVRKSYPEILDSGTLTPDRNGIFEVTFKSVPSDEDISKVFDYYYIDVKLTDATGETMAASSSLRIGDFNFSIQVRNRAVGSIATPGRTWPEDISVKNNVAEFSFRLENGNSVPAQARVSYKIIKDGKTVYEGEADTEELITKDLEVYGSGVFKIQALTRVRGLERSCSQIIVVTKEEDEALYGDFGHFFKALEGEGISAQFGATASPVWAVAQLFGNDGTVIFQDLIHIDARSGEKGSLKTLDYEYKPEYPSAVRLIISYFQDCAWNSFSADFIKKEPAGDYPLTFSRFTDKAYAGEKCSYELIAWPGTELAVAVFDKSTEAFRSNTWYKMHYSASSRNFPTINNFPGRVYGNKTYYPESELIPFQLGGNKTMKMGTRSSVASAGSPAVVTDLMLSITEDEAVVESSADTAVSAEGASDMGSDAVIRKDFAKVLFFEPFLRADESGRAAFAFTAGDKLGTFNVAVLAHDKELNSKVLSQEMLINLPVQLSVFPPDYLYVGDKYSMSYVLSNLTEQDVDGELTLSVYDGTDYESAEPVSVRTGACQVASHSSSNGSFYMDVPSGIDTLGLKLVYKSAKGWSDGVFVAIPVRKPVQTVRESHSAVLRPGMDRDSLASILRGQFVNVLGESAEIQSVKLSDLLHQAIPESVDAGGNDAVSVSGALLAEVLAGVLEDSANVGEDSSATGLTQARAERVAELLEELLSFRNADGGYGWFRGASSSPVISLLVLERFAVMIDKGADEVRSAVLPTVQYVDNYYFAKETYPLWCGGISLPQFLYTRSLYSDIPLSASLSNADAKNFRKTVKSYLLPQSADPAGYILAKARRINTLANLMEEDNAFAESIGLRVNTRARKALSRYVTSLKEYAVAHSSGGCYYPNAVMPLRGLLENEAYAHSLICDLMERFAGEDAGCGRIAEGIRLWIMLQKETQNWSSDPSFLFAMNSVIAGSQELKSTEILVLTGEADRPFSDIKAAGNGMSVKCTYYRQVTGDSDAASGSVAAGDASGSVASPTASAAAGASEYPGFEVLKEGEQLNVGDKVMAVYELWSEENRSFVRFEAPRPACLRPESQLSGYMGLGVGPLRVSGFRIVYPFCYREVRSDASIYYFDVFQEESRTITETFYVTQAGQFSSAAPAIVSLYAPHYGATAPPLPPLSSHTSGVPTPENERSVLR